VLARDQQVLNWQSIAQGPRRDPHGPQACFVQKRGAREVPVLRMHDCCDRSPSCHDVITRPQRCNINAAILCGNLRASRKTDDVEGKVVNADFDDVKAAARGAVSDDPDCVHFAKNRNGTQAAVVEVAGTGHASVSRDRVRAGRLIGVIGNDRGKSPCETLFSDQYSTVTDQRIKVDYLAIDFHEIGFINITSVKSQAKARYRRVKRYFKFRIAVLFDARTAIRIWEALIVSIIRAGLNARCDRVVDRFAVAGVEGAAPTLRIVIDYIQKSHRHTF